MLIATKVGKKRNIIFSGVLIMAMFSASIYVVYDYYIESLNLTANNTSNPAYTGEMVFDSVVPESDGEVTQISASKLREIFNIDLFRDPKFRSLKENPTREIDVKTGKRDPFRKSL